MTIFDYTVNYCDVGIVVLLILAAVIGYRRGLVLSIVNFIRYSVGLTLCFFLSKTLSPGVYDAYIKPECLKVINEQIVTSQNTDEVLSNLKHYAASLPDFISNNLHLDKLEISSDNLSESILKNVFEPVALVITQLLVFLAVFLVFFAITGVIIAIFRSRSKQKEIERGGKTKAKVLDCILGSVFGLMRCCVFIFAATAIIMYIISLDESLIESNSFLAEASNSGLIKYIDGINPYNVVTEGLI